MPLSRQPDLLPCHHGLRRQAIVQSLLADVVQGRLRAGGHLVTQELAERFRVSHTPIREALSMLAGIGVIDLVPNRGAVVRRLTPHEVREIAQVRRALECEATRLASGRIPPADLHALAAALRPMTADGQSGPAYVAEARAVDSRLHDLIADSSGNGFLAEELSRLKTLFRAFRDAAWVHDEARNDYRRLAEEAREHLAIVEALLAGDGRAAARAMSHHIRHGLKYWSRALPDSDGRAGRSPRRDERMGQP